METVEARSPGRVNLIGEHTDYNDGFVLPAAIGYYTNVRAARRDDRALALRSDGFGEAIFDPERLPKSPRGDWSDYAAGVFVELQKAGIAPPACDLHVSSTIPPGSGLSSSAAVEVALAFAIAALAGATPERVEIARVAQRAENDFVGARTGIMDQFAVLFGRAGSAVLLDTRSLQYSYAAVPERGRIVVCDTKVRHTNAGGAYNERRAQCEAAVKELRRVRSGIRALRDVTIEELLAHEGDLPRDVFRRARHVVTENARVLAAVEALRAGRLAEFGALMNASHDSLRDDYEVSSLELDAMVAAARALPGVYGARMTGGGFGGCTVNLVDAERAGAFAVAIVAAYRNATGIEAAVYDGTPVDGARVA